MSSVIAERLSRVNWDFPKAGNSADSINSLHWFAGNYIPQIPSYLLQILSEPGDLILDPFCGSGTTALEAIRAGRNVIASDILSACVFLTRCKLETATRPPSRREISSVLAELMWLGRPQGEGTLAADLKPWYSEATFAQLEFLSAVVQRGSEAIKPALELIFSNVLFACASPGKAVTKTGLPRLHHWGWIADKVLPRVHANHDAVELFHKSLYRLQMMPELDFGAHPEGQYLVTQSDARRLSLDDGSIDCVVTSPPYIGMIDYARSHRLTYMWKGWRVDDERENEIGARYKRFRKALVEEYLEDMALCLREIARVLKIGGHCAIVIGESRKFKGTVKALMERTQGDLSVVWGPVSRIHSRRRVPDREVSEGQEYICVFRKGTP